MEKTQQIVMKPAQKPSQYEFNKNAFMKAEQNLRQKVNDFQSQLAGFSKNYDFSNRIESYTAPISGYKSQAERFEENKQNVENG